MKHLKKFNESIEEGLDIEYIKFCFIDMIEADKEVGEITYWNQVSQTDTYQVEYSETSSETITNVFIFIKCPQLNIKHTPNYGFKGDFSKFVEYNKAFADFLDELGANIEKLKDEYPDYLVSTALQQEIGVEDYFVIEVKK